jgi:hypothetical protein
MADPALMRIRLNIVRRQRQVMSRYSLNLLCGFALLFACAPGVGWADTPSSLRAVQDLVRSVGQSDNRDSSDVVAELHRHGQVAVPLLIAELKVVDPDPRVTPENLWWHLVWCERALRSITGQRFMFKTKEPIPPDLDRFRAPDDPLSYAMEWMSRGMVFIAPRDVQSQVIASWKAWFAKNGSSFEVRIYEPYGDWFF